MSPSKSTDSLYLDKLRFDRKLFSLPIAFLFRNTRLLFLAMLALILAGLYSFSVLPRELNPEVEIPIVSVTTVLPGANPLDVEELVTKKIESEVDTLSTVTALTSSSSEGVSVVTAEFGSNEDPDEALQDVKERVDLVTDLPDDATTPRVVKLDFNDQPVLQVALLGDVDRYSLSHIGTQIQDILEDDPAVRRVDLQGEAEEELVISLRPETLQSYQLSATQIQNAIQSSDVNIPAGSVTVNQTEYQVTLDNRVVDAQSLRELAISTSNGTVQLGEVADIFYREVETNTTTTHLSSDGTRRTALQLSVYKAQSATIIDAAQKAREVLDQEITKYPGIQTEVIIDTSDEITEQFGELTGNFRDTVLLVFAILFLFLGLRQAAIASLSIPLTFLSTFVIMYVLGFTINFLSLFSLLLALGLVVDDAIVIVQAAHRYGKKFPPMEMGLLVFRDFVIPIWTTTLTTVWAFLPLVLATGIIGEFIKSIPVVVSATLLSSTTIAVFINLPLVVLFSKLRVPKRVKMLVVGLGLIGTIVVLLTISGSSPIAPAVIGAWLVLVAALVVFRKQVLASLQTGTNRASTRFRAVKKAQKWFYSNDIINNGLIDITPLTTGYRDLLTKIVSSKARRIWVYAIVVVFFVTSIVFAATGLLQNEFFPKVDAKQLYINVEGPAGWPLEKTKAVLADMEEVALSAPEVEYALVQTGANVDPQAVGGNSANGGSHLGYIVVVLPNEEDRERSSIEIADDFRTQLSGYSEAKVSVTEVNGGPPAGADLQVNIYGSDLDQLETISQDFASMLENDVEGAINVSTSLSQSAGQIKVVLNEHELAERSLSAVQVAGWLRTAVTGADSGTITLGDQEIDVVTKLSDDDTELSMLQNLVLPLQMGGYSLAEVSELVLETSPTSIAREDSRRVVRVTAAADGVATPALLAEFQAVASEYEIPVGYTWDVGGANEENQESTQSIIQAMGLSVILILITMVVQLNSFRKSFLVLVVIPLAVAGVFFNFTILGIPLGFASLIGVLALFGIVVNNSIMLIEKINQNIASGLPFIEAVVDACSSRLEAILFTSLTTSIGLLPITVADPFWRGLGGAIIAGLSVSGLLILFLLPTLYVELFANSEGAQKKRRVRASA